MAKTKVYLVGAGPGDPGLITENGIKALKKAGAGHIEPLTLARGI